MTHRTDSAQYRSYFRSRREFLVRSAAAMAGGGVIAQWNPNMLWAAPSALTARETATGFLATLSSEQR
ncbi:MAG: twin-arginine translocation signal domain-containing protein, partial [Pirellula sp.]